MAVKKFDKPLFRDFSRVQIRAVTDDSQTGGGEGCGNVTGFLDSWGTLIASGGFSDTLDSLSEGGFLCDGHGRATNGYTEDSNLGYFTNVTEDKEGLQLTWAYHSKQKAQEARATLSERLAAGKKSGLSIGFYVGNGITPPKGYVYDPEDEDTDSDYDYIVVESRFYEEVLKVFSKPEFYQDNLTRALGFGCIYILCRVHVFETSQTLIPANEVSLIAEVRSTRRNNSTTMATKQTRDDDAKRDDAVGSLHRAFRALKNEHREHAKAMSEHLDEMSKHLSKLSKRDDDDEQDDDDDEPEKEGKKSRRNRAKELFEGRA